MLRRSNTLLHKAIAVLACTAMLGSAAKTPAQAASATSQKPAATQVPPATAHTTATPPPANTPRIITLSPHITELMFAAGAGEYIVATVLSSDYPPAARDIPRIGNGLEVSTEKILAYRPTAVMTWQTQGASPELANTLSELHIPLLHSRPEKLSDIPAEITRYGQLFNTQAQANATAQALTQRLQALAQQYAHKTPVSVFIEVGDSPLYTIGADPLLNDALHLCGGANLYENAPVAAPQVSVESILVQQPDALIAPAKTKSEQADIRERWASLQLPAALHGHVYTIDPDTLFRASPRLIDATEALCHMLDQAR